jgi:hypothetical protein
LRVFPITWKEEPVENLSLVKSPPKIAKTCLASELGMVSEGANCSKYQRSVVSKVLALFYCVERASQRCEPTHISRSVGLGKRYTPALCQGRGRGFGVDLAVSQLAELARATLESVQSLVCNS